MLKVQVIKEHRTEYINPITFIKGEAIQIGEEDIEYPGWVRVTTENENSGWAPKSYVSNSKALKDYTAKELDTCLNELLIIHFELNGWSWVQNSLEEKG